MIASKIAKKRNERTWFSEGAAIIKRKHHVPKDFTVYRQKEENKPITTGRVGKARSSNSSPLENLEEIGDFASIESAKPIPV